MGLRHHLHLLYRWLWLIILGTLLAGGAAYGISTRIPPTYSASLTIMVYQAPASSGTSDYTEILTSARMVRTFAQAVNAHPILQTVIDELALSDSVESLAERVEVQAVRDAQLIDMTVEDGDPQRAADIANALARVFIQQNLDLNASLYAESKQTFEAEIAAIQADIDNVQQRLNQLGDVRTFTEQAEYDRLQMLLWQYRSTYSMIFHSLENVRAAEAQTTNLLHVIEPAMPVAQPASPRPFLYTALGAMLGGFLMVLGITLRDYLDTAVREGGALSRLTGSPLLAAIPRLHGGIAARLVIDSKGEDPAAAAYSILGARLVIDNGRPAPRSLLITSSRHTEGKTVSALNLAATLAQSGQRIILVDANLHRPTLHTFFSIDNQCGLTTLLRGEQADWQACLQSTGTERLRLLPAGPPATNPARLLLSPPMNALIVTLANDADLVVLDGPALLDDADTALLARHVDGVLLVVASGVTPADVVSRAAALLAQDNARLLGTVLNREASGPGRRGHLPAAATPDTASIPADSGRIHSTR